MQRSSCQQEPAHAGEVQQELPPLGFEVLDVLSLVQDEILPLEPSEGAVVLNDQLVARDTNVECVLFGPTNSLQSPLLLTAVVDEDLEAGAPLLYLHLPVEHHRGGHYDEVGAPVITVGGEVSKTR